MMVVVEERHTRTGKRRFRIVSAPTKGTNALPDIGTGLQRGSNNSWKSLRRAQRICDRWNSRGRWERVVA